jgi:hypothetical protein
MIIISIELERYAFLLKTGHASPVQKIVQNMPQVLPNAPDKAKILLDKLPLFCL